MLKYTLVRLQIIQKFFVQMQACQSTQSWHTKVKVEDQKKVNIQKDQNKMARY